MAVAFASMVALLAPPVAAAAEFELVGDSSERLVSDGRRFVAFMTPGGLTEVVDTRGSESFEITTPDGCDQVAAIGGGEVAWSWCDYEFASSTPALLLDLRTRVVHEPAGLQALLDYERLTADPTDWRGIGSQWMRGVRHHSGGGGATDIRESYLNWRTGRHLLNRPASPRRIADLGLPGLKRTLCRPLERRRTPDDGDQFTEFPPFQPYQYERPFGLAVRGSTLELDRCGKHRPLRLGRVRDGSQQLGGGWVTWIAMSAKQPYGENAVRAYDLHSGKHLRLPLAGRPTQVVHTSTDVFVAVYSPGETAKIHRAPLPRR